MSIRFGHTDAWPGGPRRKSVRAMALRWGNNEVINTMNRSVVAMHPAR
jgi:hypothetical protein